MRATVFLFSAVLILAFSAYVEANSTPVVSNVRVSQRADDSKLVDRLGNFPLPVEVVPLAQRLVSEEIVSACGGRPVLREGFTTDNGNLILDVHDLVIAQPVQLEERLNQITGVVANGLFCRRPADLLLMASDDNVMVIG